MAKTRAMPRSPEIFFSRVSEKLDGIATAIARKTSWKSRSRKLKELREYYKTGMGGFKNRPEPFFKDRRVQERHALEGELYSVVSDAAVLLTIPTKPNPERLNEREVISKINHIARKSRGLAQLFSPGPISRQSTRIKNILQEIRALGQYSFSPLR